MNCDVWSQRGGGGGTLTNTNDFLFANGAGIDLCDKLLDGDVRVLVHVRINVSLVEGLQLI